MSEIIDKAIETINAGWIKYSCYIQEQNAYCVNGALARGITGLTDVYSEESSPYDMVNRSKEGKVVCDVVKEQFPDRTHGNTAFGLFLSDYSRIIALFNDDPDTTFEDVLLVLEKANVELDSQV